MPLELGPEHGVNWAEMPDTLPTILQPEGWMPAEDVPTLLEDMKDKKQILGLEIGTDLGISTRYLLDKLPNLYLHGVDPYEVYSEMPNRFETYDWFTHLMKPYEKRFKLHRARSTDAVTLFENEMFDFIFIDGRHEYGGVKEDLENYYPKLKIGGLFCGHDYDTGSWPGVKMAVNEFVSTLDNKQVSCCKQDVWYWRK